MSGTLDRVKRLVATRSVKLSDHGLERLIKYDIEYGDILAGIDRAILVEDYPRYVHGPTVLVLQFDSTGQPIHILWGLPAGGLDVAVVVTAYRPDPRRWDESFTKRL